MLQCGSGAIVGAVVGAGVGLTVAGPIGGGIGAGIGAVIGAAGGSCTYMSAKVKNLLKDKYEKWKEQNMSE